MTRRARKWSDDARRQLLEDLDGSGMSVAAFARERGVTAWTIYSWRRQKRAREHEDGSAEFIRVRVMPKSEGPAPFEVDLRDGVRVHVRAGFDEIELRRLLGVLASC